MSYKVIYLPGYTTYQDGLEIQKKLFQLVENNTYEGFLIILEHTPVLTMGIRTDADNLLVSKEQLTDRGIELYQTDRGGDITFHGPGQIVAYPILRYRNFRLRLSDYMHALESVVIDTLKQYNVSAYSRPEFPGVWVDDTKLCAIGVRAKKYITYHGLAFNVTTDLSYFNVINPCGITEYQVGKMEDFVQRPNIEEVKQKLIINFNRQFHVTFEPDTLENITTNNRRK